MSQTESCSGTIHTENLYSTGLPQIQLAYQHCTPSQYKLVQIPKFNKLGWRSSVDESGQLEFSTAETGAYEISF